MKFVKIFLSFILIITFIPYEVKSENLKSNTFLKSNLKLKIDSNSILDRVRGLIREISNQHLKSASLSIKKKIAGVLPEGYPQEMIDNAKKMRHNKKIWSSLMSFPTEVWRFCLFPNFKVNYKNWCMSQFPTGTKDEQNCIFL